MGGHASVVTAGIKGLSLSFRNIGKLLMLGATFWCAAVFAAPSPVGAAKGVLPGASDPAVTNSVNSTAENSIQTLAKKLEDARQSLAIAMAPGEDSWTNAPAGISPQDISSRRTLLERLVRVYEQQLSAAKELETATNRKQAASREAQAWTGFSEPMPYSIHLTDQLREEIQAERAAVAGGGAAIQVVDQLIEENRNSLKQAEERIRQLNEQLEKTTDTVLSSRLSWQWELERLRSNVAVASANLLEAERRIREENLAASRTHLGLVQRQVVIADAGARFSQADLDVAITQLERERSQVEKELAEARSRRDAAVQSLQSAREDLLLLKNRPEATPDAVLNATELVNVREAELDTADTAIRVLRLVLECGNGERNMWEQRFAAYDSRSSETLNQSERRLETVSRRAALWRDHERQQLEMASTQVQLQETRLNSLPRDSQLWPLEQQRLVALRERDQLVLRGIRNIERLERLAQRWGEGLAAAEGNLPFTGKVKNLFSDTRSFASRLWNLEVFSAEDTITVDGEKITGKRSVTISKIVSALLILGAGYWLSGWLTRLLEPVFVRRLKIEANQATLIRRWLRALFVVCLVIFSLVSVKIPLTVFAFAGGALAIGLGFGMQTMLKNFVSGLIILFERPFRVGDVLDVAGQRGAVTSVGLRASVLQLWDGTETLIPNSTLLENNLTNWTYTNRQVRFIVTVGVAYGTEPRRVIQLLGQIAERHGLVEKDPKPQVFFADFGESTLLFELRFWLDVTRTNAAQVSSDLRMMIASTFSEHGIVIAYPQRDLHLDASRPIAVEVVSAAEREP